MVNFTIGANSIPSQTVVGNTITLYYKLVYSRWYGNGSYSADESTDTIGFIDTDEFKAELNALISSKIQLWHEAGKHSDGSVRPMPPLNLYYDSDVEEERLHFIHIIDSIVNTDTDVEYIDNVRIMGSTFSDYERL